MEHQNLEHQHHIERLQLSLRELAERLQAALGRLRAEVAAAFKPGDHGSTFGGGPAICAAGRATIAALVAERLGENAAGSGEYLLAGLMALAEATGEIADVRGAGLMVGVSLKRPVAAEAAARCLAEGLVVNSIGTDILRFLPPLVCGKVEIDTLLSTLSDILTEVTD